MSQDEITLVCEGEPRGRDVRWLNLVLGDLAMSLDRAGRVRVVPAGSKADLRATVRGMREALRTARVYAVRDRDFLSADLVGKDEAGGVYSLSRHCIESYMAEPTLLATALASDGMEERILALAERRFWTDIGRAVLDAVGYEMRKDRPHLGEKLPVDKADVIRTVTEKLDGFRRDLATKPLAVEVLVESFEQDMRSAPLWMRVNGKELLRSLAQGLDAAALPGGDIEATLFAWCSKNGSPEPLVLELKQILDRLPP
jgi:hypothetical protein